MNTKHKTNWWIDVVLFSGFILAFFLDLTGVGLHQWLGTLGGLLAVYHLLLHREWVDAVGERLFGRTSGRARLYYVLDTLLFAGFVLMVFTGLLISTWLNLALSSYAAWLTFHILVSIGTLLILLVKLGLHWRWIVKTAGEVLGRAGAGLPAQPMQPARPIAPARAIPGRRYSRRDFLQVMGVVGGASLLALLNAGGSLAALQQDEGATETTQVSSVAQSGGASVSAWGSSSSACQVQCDRGCSFPGHCRRYVDADNNNRCDLGECA